MYPALYATASEASAAAQKNFLWLIRIEYFLLLACAVLSIDFFENATYFVLYAGILLLSLGVLIFRSVCHFERDWYQARALAESIKTSTWRYMMKAHPYDLPEADARDTLREHLRAILRMNERIGTAGSGRHADERQVTERMATTRLLSLLERRSLYQQERIAEQRRWYRTKSEKNRAAFNAWFAASIIAYIIAIGFALEHIVYPEAKFMPTEPLLVLASSLVGWVQVKKHRELAASYMLTAHEIGLTDDRITDVTEESSMSAFVNETELAFSREHTQWVARQQTAVE